MITGIPGFEPRIAEPESAVLPLDHIPKVLCELQMRLYHQLPKTCKQFY